MTVEGRRLWRLATGPPPPDGDRLGQHDGTDELLVQLARQEGGDAVEGAGVFPGEAVAGFEDLEAGAGDAVPQQLHVLRWRLTVVLAAGEERGHGQRGQAVP